MPAQVVSAPQAGTDLFVVRMHIITQVQYLCIQVDQLGSMSRV